MSTGYLRPPTHLCWRSSVLKTLGRVWESGLGKSSVSCTPLSNLSARELCAQGAHKFLDVLTGHGVGAHKFPGVSTGQGGSVHSFLGVPTGMIAHRFLARMGSCAHSTC